MTRFLSEICLDMNLQIYLAASLPDVDLLRSISFAMSACTHLGLCESICDEGVCYYMAKYDSLHVRRPHCSPCSAALLAC